MPSTIENLEVSPSAGRVLREILITNVRSFVFRRAGYSCVLKPQMDSWDGEREHLRAILKQLKAHTKICARSSLVQTQITSRTSGKLHIVPDFIEVVLSLWRVGPCCIRHETSVYHTPRVRYLDSILRYGTSKAKGWVFPYGSFSEAKSETRSRFMGGSVVINLRMSSVPPNGARTKVS